MQFVVDTHVHIYPFYQVDVALSSILRNLSRFGEKSVKIACLTERYDCELYQELASSPRREVAEKFRIENRSTHLLIQELSGAGEFSLLPGQQIITKENIEILSLACLHRVAEGNSAQDTVHDILRQKGIPVVAWAPGKWFFQRGKVVKSLIEKFGPSELALGDTTLRPLGWGMPSTMFEARRDGYRILYGSDPLPFRGEEATPGSYATLIQGTMRQDEKCRSNADAILKSVLTANMRIQPVGSRGTIPQVLKRLYKNKRAPKPLRETK